MLKLSEGHAQLVEPAQDPCFQSDWCEDENAHGHRPVPAMPDVATPSWSFPQPQACSSVSKGWIKASV